MLVLSCDDVPANPLPATGRQAGVDVGIAQFRHHQRRRARRQSALGPHAPRTDWPPRSSGWPAPSAGRTTGHAKRETVAARHRKIANQRKDFHHKTARTLVERYDLMVVEDLAIANMVRRAKPVARSRQSRAVPAQRCPGEVRAESKYQ